MYHFPNLSKNTYFFHINIKTGKNPFLLQTPINIIRNQASMEYGAGSSVMEYSIKMINSCLNW